MNSSLHVNMHYFPVLRQGSLTVTLTVRALDGRSKLFESTDAAE
jgi:hypothetical protein